MCSSWYITMGWKLLPAWPATGDNQPNLGTAISTPFVRPRGQQPCHPLGPDRQPDRPRWWRKGSFTIETRSGNIPWPVSRASEHTRGNGGAMAKEELPVTAAEAAAKLRSGEL